MNALHDVLHDLAADVAPADLRGRVVAGVRRRRRQRLAGAGAGLAAVVAVAALAVPHRRDDSAGIVAPASGSPSASQRAVTPAAAPLYDLVWRATEANGVLHQYGRTPGGRTVEVGPPSLAGPGDLSPDGRLLAYPDYPGLTVLDLKTGKKRVFPKVPITADDAGQKTSEGNKGVGWGEVTWSPDGRTLAVDDTRHKLDFDATMRGFFLIDAVTGAYTRVAYDHRSGGSWSPDGTMLAVTARNGDGVDVITRGGTLVRHLDIAGGGFPYLASRHAWSPDGDRLLVFVEGPGTGESDELVVSATTGAVVVRLKDGGTVWRDATHVACECTRGVVTVRTLDGKVTETLLRVDDSRLYGLVIRPAS
jgi:hypothetical protein